MPFLSGLRAPIIAVDFDGTIKSTTDWRNMNTPLMEGCKEALQELKALGCQLVLWTSRAQGEEMLKVMHYLIRHDIVNLFDSFNKNAPSVDFETSRKIYADVYIDDNNVGGFVGWKEAVAYVKAKMQDSNS